MQRNRSKRFRHRSEAPPGAAELRKITLRSAIAGSAPGLKRAHAGSGIPSRKFRLIVLTPKTNLLERRKKAFYSKHPAVGDVEAPELTDFPAAGGFIHPQVSIDSSVKTNGCALANTGDESGHGNATETDFGDPSCDRQQSRSLMPVAGYRIRWGTLLILHQIWTGFSLRGAMRRKISA